MRRNHVKLRRRIGGATLVETLISILILSAGLLGMVSLQGSALAYQRTASVQVMATQYAQALGDMVRANPDALKQDGAYGWTEKYMSGVEPVGASCSMTDTCTAGEVAAAEVKLWLAQVRRDLPHGDAFIQPSPIDSSINVWMMWRHSSTVPSGSTDPTCAADAIQHLDPGLRPHCIFLKIRL